MTLASNTLLTVSLLVAACGKEKDPGTPTPAPAPGTASKAPAPTASPAQVPCERLFTDTFRRERLAAFPRDEESAVPGICAFSNGKYSADDRLELATVEFAASCDAPVDDDHLREAAAARFESQPTPAPSIAGRAFESFKRTTPYNLGAAAFVHDATGCLLLVTYSKRDLAQEELRELARAFAAQFAR